LIDGLYVLAGNDDIFLRTLEMGGNGCISVASHVVGDDMRRIWDEPDQRAEIDASMRDVYSTLFITANPICVKAALNMLGHDVGGLRLPLVDASDAEAAEVRAMLERHGLLSPAHAG
jgi:4-hydroxy-tetrahydrodipicolinate synthase